MPALQMIGSRGSDTKALQSRLNQVLLPSPQLDVDGIFGSLTDQAVRRFQVQRKILVDGIVGPQTWGELSRSTPGRGGQKPGSGGGVSTSQEASFQVAERALEIAFGQRGVMEQPVGSNSGPRVDHYLASVGCPPGLPWCMAFVHWSYYMAANQLGLPNPAYRSASCTHVYNWAVNNGKIVDEPKSGDVFLVQGGGGQYTHTGIIIRASGRLTTIEGNTNDNGSPEGIGVYYRLRSQNGLSYMRLPDLTEDTDWWEM